MGANKTETAIDRISKAFTGVQNIVNSFDKQVQRHPRSSKHSHRSSSSDGQLIQADLRVLRPFQHVEDRCHDTFQGIPANPLHNVDKTNFARWLAKHKQNIAMHFPCDYDNDDNDDIDIHDIDMQL